MVALPCMVAIDFQNVVLVQFKNTIFVLIIDNISILERSLFN